MKTKRQYRNILVQAKISEEAAERLDKIVREYGFGSRYEVMQYLLSAFLRFVDVSSGDKSEMDEAMIEIGKIFEGWENSAMRQITVSTSKPKRYKLTDALNIFREGDKKIYTCTVISIKEDKTTIKRDVESALRLVLMSLYPALYAKLEAMREEIGGCSLSGLIEQLTEQRANEIKDEVQKEMDLFGGSIEYGNVPKKSRSKYEQRL